MISPGILYTTAALMTLVAVACTALALAWSVPAWRRRLGAGFGNSPARGGGGGAGALTGWPHRVGGAAVSAGIAGCAAVAWYGAYCAATAVM